MADACPVPTLDTALFETFSPSVQQESISSPRRFCPLADADCAAVLTTFTSDPCGLRRWLGRCFVSSLHNKIANAARDLRSSARYG